MQRPSHQQVHVSNEVREGRVRSVLVVAEHDTGVTHVDPPDRAVWDPETPDANPALHQHVGRVRVGDVPSGWLVA
jgi:hypothetical protein